LCCLRRNPFDCWLNDHRDTPKRMSMKRTQALDEAGASGVPTSVGISRKQFGRDATGMKHRGIERAAPWEMTRGSRRFQPETPNSAPPRQPRGCRGRRSGPNERLRPTSLRPGGVPPNKRFRTDEPILLTAVFMLLVMLTSRPPDPHRPR
jgi:hypothetical protein